MTPLPVTTRQAPWRGQALSAAFHAVVAGIALLTLGLRPPPLEPPLVVELVMAAPAGGGPVAASAAASPAAPASTASAPDTVAPRPGAKPEVWPRPAAKATARPPAKAPLAAPTPAPEARSEPEANASPVGEATADETATGEAPAGGTAGAPAAGAASGGAGEGSGSGDNRPAYRDNPLPSYPLAARRRGIEGAVALKVAVDAEGRPQAVAVVASSGSDMLDEAALNAVRRWRFTPARRGGVAVAADIIVPIRFQLDGIAVADAR